MIAFRPFEAEVDQVTLLAKSDTRELSRCTGMMPGSFVSHGKQEVLNANESSSWYH